MRTRLVLGLFAVFAAAGCTSLLGTFETGSGTAAGGDGGDGATTDGATTDGATTDGALTDGAVTDAASDSPADAGCGPLRPNQCGAACVNLQLDKNNCGACGRSCLGGDCVAQTCLPGLLSARTDIVPITLTATDKDLFFATATNDVIQLPLVGAAPAPITLATPGFQVYATAPAGADVFFTVADAASGGAWSVWKATAGTPMSAVMRNNPVTGTPVGLVVVPGNSYVFTQNVTAAASFQITACPPSSNCFSNPGGTVPGGRMAAGNGYVYWADRYDKVNAMPDAVGLTTVIGAALEHTPVGPVWDGALLFWVNSGSSPNKIRRSSYPNPAPADVRDLTGSYNDLVVDATNLFFAEGNGVNDQLFFAPKLGSAAAPATRMASGPNNTIVRLAQNGTAIYWADNLGIHVVRKP
jgi:hypothetical protein